MTPVMRMSCAVMMAVALGASRGDWLKRDADTTRSSYTPSRPCLCPWRGSVTGVCGAMLVACTGSLRGESCTLGVPRRRSRLRGRSCSLSTALSSSSACARRLSLSCSSARRRTSRAAASRRGQRRCAADAGAVDAGVPRRSGGAVASPVAASGPRAAGESASRPRWRRSAAPSPCSARSTRGPRPPGPRTCARDRCYRGRWGAAGCRTRARGAACLRRTCHPRSACMPARNSRRASVRSSALATELITSTPQAATQVAIRCARLRCMKSPFLERQLDRENAPRAPERAACWRTDVARPAALPPGQR